MNPSTTPARDALARTARALRLERGLTQAELAARLGLSQNRLSEIERGKGSFSAEQFLGLLKVFNVPVSAFEAAPAPVEASLQNSLARLGAAHLVERADLLPSERLAALEDVVREVLVAGDNPRHLAALAPVLAEHLPRLNLPRLWARFTDYGLEHRLGWLLENVLEALRHPPAGQPSLDQAARLRESRTVLEEALARFHPRALPGAGEDVLGARIPSPKTRDALRRRSSTLSRRWGILSGLQPSDFVEALHAAQLAR